MFGNVLGPYIVFQIIREIKLGNLIYTWRKMGNCIKFEDAMRTFTLKIHKDSSNQNEIFSEYF